MHAPIGALLTAGADWKKELDKQGIVIFTRTPEQSKLKGFKAEATLSGTTVDEVQSLLMDVEQYGDWVSDVKSVEVLEDHLPGRVLYHVRLGVPFPFEQRDMVQEMRVKRLSDTVVRIDLMNRPDAIEPLRKAVRMPSADGHWDIEAVDQDTVQICFEYYSDPGGGIPPWLVNMFIVQSPYKTIKNLRTLVSE